MLIADMLDTMPEFKWDQYGCEGLDEEAAFALTLLVNDDSFGHNVKVSKSHVKLASVHNGYSFTLLYSLYNGDVILNHGLNTTSEHVGHTIEYHMLISYLASLTKRLVKYDWEWSSVDVFEICERLVRKLKHSCGRIRHSDILEARVNVMGFETLRIIVAKMVDCGQYIEAVGAYAKMFPLMDFSPGIQSGISLAAAVAAMHACEYTVSESFYAVHISKSAFAGGEPCWQGMCDMYDRAGNDVMKAAVADILAGAHHVPMRKFAQVHSVSDFRALLCKRTAPPPIERDARVDELAAAMQALRLKREAREAAVEAEGREKEAARRERIRSARAARANTRVRESALGKEKPRAGPKRSPRAPLDAAEAARDTAKRGASKVAAADHTKALRDQEAARQAELEARAEYARIGHAIQRGEPVP